MLIKPVIMKCTNDAKLVQCWSSFVRFCAQGNVYDNHQLFHCEHNAGYLLRKDKEANGTT